MNWLNWLIAGFFISIPILIYGGLIISGAENYQSKKRYYFGVFIVLLIIGFSIWLIDKGYIDRFLSSFYPSINEEYTPGEYYPF